MREVIHFEKDGDFFVVASWVNHVYYVSVRLACKDFGYSVILQ